MDPMNVLAKFVPGIIEGTLKLWAVPGHAVQVHRRSLILHSFW